MLIWCQKFSKKLKDVKIVNRILHRMVNDITIMPNIIEPGTVYENNKLLVRDEKVEEEKLIPDDIRTMKLIQSIANEIDDTIKVTFGVPSNHKYKRVPILDVKVKMLDNGKLNIFSSRNLWQIDLVH